MNTEQKNKIEDFLKNLDTDIDILNFVDVELIELDFPFESLWYILDYNGGFNVDIIYHDKAMDYLKENDPSLRKSINLALRMGHNPDQLHSELLASLLASYNTVEKFNELEDEINKYIRSLR